MNTEGTQHTVIRHRPVFALPTRVSFWSLILLTAVFFLLFLGYFLYTRVLAHELERDEDALSRAAAQFMVNAVSPLTGLEDPERLLIFIQSGTDTEVLRELVNEVDHPMVFNQCTGRLFNQRSGCPEKNREDSPADGQPEYAVPDI